MSLCARLHNPPPGTASASSSAAGAGTGSKQAPLLAGTAGLTAGLQRSLAEVASLYKGVVSAATGAGIIIGAYFAFYSTSKRFLKEKTDWKEGASRQKRGAAGRQ